MSDLGAAVLLQTLVVEAVDLSDLPGLVVTPQYRDPLPRRETVQHFRVVLSISGS